MPCDNLPAPDTPEVCREGGSALLLPAFSNEHTWPDELRFTLYLVGLLYCFCGVAIIADVFCGAIEKITSKKVLIWDKKLKKKRTLTVWNATVANLTLMAFGSSAPEILLNVVGIFPTFIAGDLGPGTIVGSAAFNLLCIIAVCVIAIPNGELRYIQDRGVFAVTASWSVFAYIWLLIILMGISPDVVEWWEGVLTFVFFWILLCMSFMADKGMLPGCKKTTSSWTVCPESSPEEMAQMQMQVQQKYGGSRALTHDQMDALIEYEFSAGAPTRAQLRVDATRGMFGGKKVLNGGGESKYMTGAKLAVQLLGSKKDKAQAGADDKPIVAFRSANLTVLESVGTVEVRVIVKGNLKQDATVKYKTRDATAKKGEDYEEAIGSLNFGPGKLEQSFKVKIIKSEGYEHTETFHIDLEELPSDAPLKLGNGKTASIVIVDEDRPGVLSFEKEQIDFTPQTTDAFVPIKITRKHGTSGTVSCTLCTEDGTAVHDADYEPLEQDIVFHDGEREHEVAVKVMANSKYEAMEQFRVVLKDAQGGVMFDSHTDGGAATCVCTVSLQVDAAQKTLTNTLLSMVSVNRDVVRLGNANYKEQFISAVYVGGSPESQKEAKALDYVGHALTVPWKVLFATVPPADYAGGWLCFAVALIMIGIVTVIIGDLAELLGCVVGMPPAVTAITLVAVGTSLPDTFASKTSATMDPFADNSIGNVTGSNSVNVFLGLGLPWMIAGVYWAAVGGCEPGDRWSLRYPEQAAQYPGGIFVVKAGSLGSSVATFTVCAIVCIVTLLLRRHFLGGELGGPKALAWLTAGFFVTLWVVYLVLSIVLGES